MGKRVRIGKTIASICLCTGLVVSLLLLGPAIATCQDRPIRGGSLNTGMVSDPPSFDSHSATSARLQAHSAAVFSGLVRTDPMKEEVTPETIIQDLAESWTVSPDKKVYTFNLRKGVKFHDGHPFTSADVKYSLDKYRDPKLSAFASNVELIDKVEATDDYTVKIYLRETFPELLLFLCPPYASIQPAHLANTNPKSVQFLVGTGPFKYKSHVSGKVYTYERNPDYFVKGLPYLDEYKVYIMAISPMIDAFIGGRLDTAGSLRQLLDMSRDNVIKVQKHAPEAVLGIKTAGSSRGLYFALKRKGPWQDVRVRRAIALAVDYEGTITAGVGGPELRFIPAAGLVPPYMSEALPNEEIAKLMGGIDQPLEKRVAKAKELLKEAGVPDGFSAELIVRSEEPTELKPAIFAADLWKRYLNVNVAVKPLDRAQFFERRDKGLFDLAFEAATTSTGVSPSDFLSLFLTRSIRNYGKWSNSEYDRLTNLVQSESDSNKRIAAAQKAQRILYEDLPYVCFHATTYATAWRPDLMTGWPAKKGLILQPTYTNFQSIDRIWFEGTAERWSKK